MHRLSCTTHKGGGSLNFFWRIGGWGGAMELALVELNNPEGRG